MKCITECISLISLLFLVSCSYVIWVLCHSAPTAKIDRSVRQLARLLDSYSDEEIFGYSKGYFNDNIHDIPSLCKSNISSEILRNETHSAGVVCQEILNSEHLDTFNSHLCNFLKGQNGVSHLFTTKDDVIQLKNPLPLNKTSYIESVRPEIAAVEDSYCQNYDILNICASERIFKVFWVRHTLTVPKLLSQCILFSSGDFYDSDSANVSSIVKVCQERVKPTINISKTTTYRPMCNFDFTTNSDLVYDRTRDPVEGPSPQLYETFQFCLIFDPEAILQGSVTEKGDEKFGITLFSQKYQQILTDNAKRLTLPIQKFCALFTRHFDLFLIDSLSGQESNEFKNNGQFTSQFRNVITEGITLLNYLSTRAESPHFFQDYGTQLFFVKVGRYLTTLYGDSLDKITDYFYLFLDSDKTITYLHNFLKETPISSPCHDPGFSLSKIIAQALSGDSLVCILDTSVLEQRMPSICRECSEISENQFSGSVNSVSLTSKCGDLELYPRLCDIMKREVDSYYQLCHDYGADKSINLNQFCRCVRLKEIKRTIGRCPKMDEETSSFLNEHTGPVSTDTYPISNEGGNIDRVSNGQGSSNHSGSGFLKLPSPKRPTSQIFKQKLKNFQQNIRSISNVSQTSEGHLYK